MAATASIVDKLAAAFPDVLFVKDESFRWSPMDRTVHYGQLQSVRDQATLLHELGHAICSHQNFTHDIDLLKMEREAWTKAQAIALDYKVDIPADTIEDALDTYRDWLDARSRCPNCTQTGVQEREDVYACLICHVAWRVNDARQCGLKRYKISLD